MTARSISNIENLSQTFSQGLTSITTDGTKYVFASLPITFNSTYDIALITCQLEATNNTGGPISFARQLILGTSPSSTTGTAINQAVSDNVMYAVSPNDYYNLWGMIQAPFTGNYFVNVVVWAGGSGVLEFQTGYSVFNAQVFRR